MSCAHHHFRNEETALWKDGLPLRLPEHIVKPSGSWSARIAHHLYNPSFTTLRPEDGEVGDCTNGCTALIMGNAYDPNTYFMFDHFHRREEFDPFSKYPIHIKALHEAHTKEIRKKVQALVEILYGSYVHDWAKQNLDMTSLQLWGAYDGVWIHFEWENSESNAEDKRIVRILVYAYHAQKMLSFNLRSISTAISQDKLISVAHKLARVPVIEDYYQTKPWSSKQDFIKLAYIKAQKSPEKSSSQEDLAMIRKYNERVMPEPVENVGGFETIVMSLQRLEYILNEVLKDGKRVGCKRFKEPFDWIDIEGGLLRGKLPPIIKSTGVTA